MLSIIKKFLTKLYQSQLNIFYFNAENDNFFSPLLYIYSQEEYKNIISEIDLIKEENNEKNEDNNDIKIKIIKTIINLYLKEFLFKSEEIKMIQDKGVNNINILLGFELPGLKNTIKNIVNNIRSNYINFSIENELKTNDIENKNTDNMKKKYFGELINFSFLSKNIINEEILFSKISNKFKTQQELYEFYDLFINLKLL